VGKKIWEMTPESYSPARDPGSPVFPTGAASSALVSAVGAWKRVAEGISSINTPAMGGSNTKINGS